MDLLPNALADAPPLPGEEARYAQTLAVVAAVKADPSLRKAVEDELESRRLHGHHHQHRSG